MQIAMKAFGLVGLAFFGVSQALAAQCPEDKARDLTIQDLSWKATTGDSTKRVTNVKLGAVTQHPSTSAESRTAIFFSYDLVIELKKGVEKTQSMAGFYAYDQNCQNVDGIAANVK
jgi:hypothetical protein